MSIVSNYFDLIVLFKFFLILIGIIYLFRWISPFIIKYLLSRLAKKMGDFDANKSFNKKTKPSKKKENNFGEYIDYEEID